MWTDVAVPILRVMINDMNETSYTYTDAKLEQVLLASAYMLVMEIDLASTYTVSMVSESISPDPESDIGFINLLVLKSVVFIKNNEAKAAQSLGVTVTDGPSSISGKGKLEAIIADAKLATAKYDKVKLEYLAGNSKAGEAVMTPFTNENVPIQDNFR